MGNHEEKGKQAVDFIYNKSEISIATSAREMLLQTTLPLYTHSASRKVRANDV